MSGERLRRDMARVGAKLPPPQPPAPDERELALQRIAFKRMGYDNLMILEQIGQSEAQSLEELSDDQRRVAETYLAIIGLVRDAAGRSGTDLIASAEDERVCERLGVEAIHTINGCELYAELWRRCWAVEDGTSDWLPDPSDLTSARMHGKPYGVTHERQVKAAPRIARKFAKEREELMRKGAEPVTDAEEARDIAERLYDRRRGHGRMGQRYGLLTELSQPGADRAELLRYHQAAIESERDSQREAWGWSQHD